MSRKRTIAARLTPKTVMRTLARGSDWYGLKKGQRQNLWDAARNEGGLRGFRERALRSMPQADISDVAYDHFLANGQPVATLDAAPGDTVRVRAIGASAATYYFLEFAGRPQIIAADGQDVVPIAKDRFLMAIAESYDLLIKVPAGGAYELRATAQDGSGHASLFIGRGRRVLAPDVPKPNMYNFIDFSKMPSPYLPWGKPMEMAGGAGGMKGMPGMKDAAGTHRDGMTGKQGMAGMMPMGGMQMLVPQAGRPGTPYADLRAPRPTALPPGRPLREYALTLTGDMERYAWMINSKVLGEAESLLVRRGENVRFRLTNQTMMHHPMHLHGHFFRVVNDQGAYAPLKHTVDVAPGTTTVIEFAANEEKDWFFHCHVLYHLKGGMARVVHYESSELTPDLVGIRAKLYSEPVYAYADANLLSQMTNGVAVLRDTRNDAIVEWEADYEGSYDTTLTYNRYFNRLFSLQLGGNFTDEARRAILGVRYLFPLEVSSTIWAGTDGNVRIEIDRELVLTPRFSIFGSYEFNSQDIDEWIAGAAYMLNRPLSIVFQHHSEYGTGAGVEVRF